MIALDNGDKIQGDGSTGAKVDYTLHGLVGSTVTQLADGQLADSTGDIYTASAAVAIIAMTLVNTDSSAITVNLYLLPSGGTARRLIPVDLSLDAGYALVFDGQKFTVMDTDGQIITALTSVVPGAHASSHENGGGDEVSVAGLSGELADDQPPKTHASNHTDGTDDIQNASTTQKGLATELATAAETTTGTDTARVVTPDGLAGSDYGKRVMIISLAAPATALGTGDGKFYFAVPAELNGYNLVGAHAYVDTVSSSGTPTYQIHNVTDTQDMLSTLITIDANEKTSYTASAQPVIDTGHDDVATGDIIRIDKDVAGTGEKGDGVILVFQLP